MSFAHRRDRDPESFIRNRERDRSRRRQFHSTIIAQKRKEQNSFFSILRRPRLRETGLLSDDAE
jgi:hypothetical protein